MRKYAGYICIAVASFLWITCLIVPFLSFSIGVKAAIIAAAVVLAEIFFWLGAFFIGKNIWHILKEKRKNKLSRK